ncbi:MAG: ATP-binding cassette domain-containing protein [Planctomycetes bacterium]|nr:ATP-binding cassette domain-containing protein [Planctomycetota bacterium]
MSIRLRGVSRRYGRDTALDAVDMHVHAGDVYGFIGHNGAGKTTTLRIVLGLVRPARGSEVRIDGHDPRANPRIRRALGGLIERPGFFDSRSARHNLRMLARLQNLTGVDAEVDRVLGLVGLSEVANRRAGALSQGMRQRLGLAQALLGQPRYLVLDEPQNGLDPEGMQQLRELLRGIARAGTTVLLSSHLLSEVADLCTRIGVLHRGRMLVEAPTDRLLAGGAQRFRLDTDDNRAAEAQLRQLGIESTVQEDGALLFFGPVDAPAAVTALARQGRAIRSFGTAAATLEQIYLQHTRSAARRSEPASGAAPDDPKADLPALRGSVRRVVRYELTRLAGPVTVVALAAPAAVGIAEILQRTAHRAQASAEVRAGTLASATDFTAFEGLGRALGAGLPLLAVVLAGLASQSLAGELGGGTLRNVLIRPLRRVEVAFGKLIGLWAVGLAGYAATAGATAAVAGMCADYGDLVEILSTNHTPFPLQSAAEVLPHLSPALLSPVVPLLAFTTLGFLVGALARTAATAMAAVVSTVVGLELLRAVARPRGLEHWLLGPYLPSPLARGSRLDAFVEIASGVNNPTLRYSDTEVWVPAAWLLVCATLAALALRRRDVA